MLVLRLVEQFAVAHPEAVVRRGGETYIAYEVVEAVINDAERRGIRVLGLEGFLIADHATYPALGRITDYRTITDVQRGAEAARALLRDAWRLPPGADDQMHSQATGRYMIAVVLDDSEP